MCSGHYGGNPFAWDGGANAPHITRYFLARGWVLPHETVFDAGCCTGYGSRMLAWGAKHVTGWDIDEGCIESANTTEQDNVEFACKDLDKEEWPDADVIVSIENIEHCVDLDHYIEQCKKHAKRLLIVCTPIGGTTWAYKDEEPSPATEKHDFPNIDYIKKLFVDDEWKEQTAFQYGYSGFCVFYKKPLKEIKW